MDARPVADAIWIEPERDYVEEQGIAMPSADRLFAFGVVVAVGPGATCPKTGKHMPLEPQIGETVAYSRDALIEPVNLGGRELLQISESDCVCRITAGTED